MPAPASEDDLKRRARRRLIGAVALTLVAVIALPLMMEDEPPPAAKLEVRMPLNGKTPDFVPYVPPAPAPVTPAQVATAPAIEPEVAAPSVAPVATPTPAPVQQQAPETKSQPVKLAQPKAPADKPKPKAEPSPQPEVKKPAQPNSVVKAESKPSVEKSGAFVVQLGAFVDATKTESLKNQVERLGMSAYTDKTGDLTRLRIGPFASREAAAAVADKLNAAGMSGRVMPK